MPLEIEHKYLIKQDLWKNVVPEKSIYIKQGFLSTGPDKVIRVRIQEDTGFITIKGKATGAVRPEYEYKIPVSEAREIMDRFTSQLIEKTRHYVTHDNKIWEVDEFTGLNEGLFVAEIELLDENEKYILPDWIDIDITHDLKYVNSNLSVHPFTKWK